MDIKVTKNNDVQTKHTKENRLTCINQFYCSKTYAKTIYVTKISMGIKFGYK